MAGSGLLLPNRLLRMVGLQREQSLIFLEINKKATRCAGGFLWDSIFLIAKHSL